MSDPNGDIIRNAASGSDLASPALQSESSPQVAASAANETDSRTGNAAPSSQINEIESNASVAMPFGVSVDLYASNRSATSSGAADPIFQSVTQQLVTVNNMIANVNAAIADMNISLANQNNELPPDADANDETPSVDSNDDFAAITIQQLIERNARELQAFRTRNENIENIDPNINRNTAPIVGSPQAGPAIPQFGQRRPFFGTDFNANRNIFFLSAADDRSETISHPINNTVDARRLELRLEREAARRAQRQQLMDLNFRPALAFSPPNGLINRNGLVLALAAARPLNAFLSPSISSTEGNSNSFDVLRGANEPGSLSPTTNNRYALLNSVGRAWFQRATAVRLDHLMVQNSSSSAGHDPPAPTAQAAANATNPQSGRRTDTLRHFHDNHMRLIRTHTNRVRNRILQVRRLQAHNPPNARLSSLVRDIFEDIEDMLEVLILHVTLYRRSLNTNAN